MSANSGGEGTNKPVVPRAPRTPRLDAQGRPIPRAPAQAPGPPGARLRGQMPAHLRRHNEVDLQARAQADEVSLSTDNDFLDGLVGKVGP